MHDEQGERRRRSRFLGLMRDFIKHFDTILGFLDGVAKAAVGAALLTIAVSLFVGATGRYIFNFSFVGGEELARYLMVWMTFIGAYVLVREQRHIMIDILLRSLPRWVSRVVAISIGVVGTAVMIYLTVIAYQLTDRMLSGGAMSPVLPVPRGVLHLSLLVGAVMMVFGFAHMALVHLFMPEEARPLFNESEAE